MILADKIINERKKNGWSQEELAEKLSVSRQSVSKWEGAQAIPDIQKVLQMADIFGVSTDYLLKEEIESVEPTGELTEVSEAHPPIRKVSLEEAHAYMNTVRKNVGKIAAAVALCITSPALLIFLGGLSQDPKYGVSENAAGGIGVITLLVMIAIAVYIFIVYGSRIDKFEYLKTEDFETEYGVESIVREKKDAYEQTYQALTAVGVITCILSVVPLLTASFLTENEVILASMVSVLLLVVAAGVVLFIITGNIMDSYKVLLGEGDFTAKAKKQNKKFSSISSAYWCLATAIFLGISFVTMAWDKTWIVWPVAGVGYGVIVAIVKAFSAE